MGHGGDQDRRLRGTCVLSRGLSHPAPVRIPVLPLPGAVTVLCHSFLSGVHLISISGRELMLG